MNHPFHGTRVPPLRFSLVTLFLAGIGYSPFTCADVLSSPATIVGKKSGRCVHVSAGSLADGAKAVLYGCSGDANQHWTLVPDGAAYEIVAEHSQKCLGVRGASKSQDAIVDQQPCSGAAHTLWSLQAFGKYHRLVAKHSGLCLYVSGASNANGAQLVQRSCTGVDSELWLSPALVPGAPNIAGRWGGIVRFPLVPVAVANLPNGKVLAWSAEDRFDFNTGSKVQTYTAIFNPASNQITERLVFETGHNMFCPGTANLPDGRILVNGGIGARATSLYNPFTNTWQAAQPMHIARGYQGTTVISSGKVFTLGGSWSGGVGGKDGELWSAASGWTLLPGAVVDPVIGPDPGGVYRGDNHLWLFGVTGGKLFHAGPHNRMNWYETNNGGNVAPAGNRGDDAYSMNGNATMYDIKKILKVGGAPAYQQRNATDRAYVINLNNGVAVSKLAPMAFARAFGSSVVLPNGQVVVVGGQSYASAFTDWQPVLAAEIWDPATGRFTTLASMQIPRTYHSAGLLLNDGRVYIGGGGLCGDCSVNHPNGEIFSPPYLFGPGGQLAARPVLTSAPTSAAAGARINVSTDRPVSKFALVRNSSDTHTVNNDQRRIPLAATVVGTNAYSLTIPADKGIVVPGYYMLFALTSSGVPSVSKAIKIT